MRRWRIADMSSTPGARGSWIFTGLRGGFEAAEEGREEAAEAAEDGRLDVWREEGEFGVCEVSTSESLRPLALLQRLLLALLEALEPPPWGRRGQASEWGTGGTERVVDERGGPCASGCHVMGSKGVGRRRRQRLIGMGKGGISWHRMGGQGGSSCLDTTPQRDRAGPRR